MIRAGQFRYVPWEDVEGMLRLGWMVVSDLGPVHGYWRALMWRCDCEAAE